MTKWWRPNERARLLLTLQLAVCLPAAALIGLSIWKLKSMGRDKVIEATIQRDFAHLLKIADKRITRRAMEMVAEVQGQFPCPDDPVAQKLDKLLEQYPYAAHLFLYDETSGMVFRSQPRRLEEAYFLAESEDLSKMMGGWMRLEAKDLVKKLHKMDHYEGERFAFYANWAPRGEKQGYQSIAFFILPKTPKDRIAFGGLVFDSEFLRDQFFPDALNNLMAKHLANPNRDKADYSQPVMMVHIRREAEPLAASAGWDGGKPEVERNFETAFPGLTLAIKFRGKPGEAVGQR